MAPARLVVVQCPQWSVVAAGCAAGEAVAVIHANRVVARSNVAAAAGVRVGQRRREAQSRCPHVHVVDHDPGRDARAFNKVVDAIADLVPRLELTMPGTLAFAARGPSRYFGGDEALAQRIDAVLDAVLAPTPGQPGQPGQPDPARAARAMRVAGRPGVGIADGRFAATVAARHASLAGCPQVIDVGGSASFLAGLALRWLTDAGGVPADQVDLLARLGLRCLGDLAALAEPDVIARFGLPGVQARQMASGCDDRPIGTADPPAGLAVVNDYDTPVHHLESLVFGARQLAERLVGALAQRGLVCTQFAVVAETEHGESCERLWSMPTGFGMNAMAERIRWQLDGWARGQGAGSDADCFGDAAGEPTSGIIRLCLDPTEVRADVGVQLGLWGGRSQADDWAQRAATRLAGLIGDEQVMVAEWCGGRQLTDAYRWVPAFLSSVFDPAPTPSRSTPSRSTSRLPAGLAADGPWPGQLPSPSPAVVHPEPIPIVVLDGAGATVTVSGRGVVSAPPVTIMPARSARSAMPPRSAMPARSVGSMVAAADVITAWAGPWVVDERWWDAARHRRVARFQFLTASGRAYVAAIEHQQWWLVAEHG